MFYCSQVFFDSCHHEGNTANKRPRQAPSRGAYAVSNVAHQQKHLTNFTLLRVDFTARWNSDL